MHLINFHPIAFQLVTCIMKQNVEFCFSTLTPLAATAAQKQIPISGSVFVHRQNSELP